MSKLFTVNDDNSIGNETEHVTLDAIVHMYTETCIDFFDTDGDPDRHLKSIVSP